MHLTRVCVCEFSELEIDDHETPQPPMKEQQVDAVPGRPYAKTPLSADEREVATKLEQERFELRN